ncbi:MAG: type I-E CRISPR-associated protein Cse2/CasB [Acidobacteriota bacterium]
MTTTAAAVERRLTSLVSHIATLLRGGGMISHGDAAALRRMDPRHPAAGFFKIEGHVLDDQLPGDATLLADLETRWAAIVVGLACLGSLHQPGRRLGHTLVDAQYSELRFTRLLRADADHLADELPALARFLAAKGTPVDWTTAAHLILSVGRSDEEPIRRHIARDYYGSLSRQEGH